jgi:hypothetical protein
MAATRNLLQLDRVLDTSGGGGAHRSALNLPSQSHEASQAVGTSTRDSSGLNRTLEDLSPLERDALLSLKPGAGLLFTGPLRRDIKANLVIDYMKQLCQQDAANIIAKCKAIDHDRNGSITKYITVTVHRTSTLLSVGCRNDLRRILADLDFEMTDIGFRKLCHNFNASKDGYIPYVTFIQHFTPQAQRREEPPSPRPSVPLRNTRPAPTKVARILAWLLINLKSMR